jgi:hypothetical protein
MVTEFRKNVLPSSSRHEMEADGGIRFLHYIGYHLQDYTASQP